MQYSSSLAMTSNQPLSANMLDPEYSQSKPPWLSQTEGRNILHSISHNIAAEPLTPDSFAAFGTVIEDPEFPHYPPRRQPYQQPIVANQGTARKYAHVSPITSRYGQAPSGIPATVQMSYFACEPRKLEIAIPRRDPFYGDERTLDSTVPHGLFKVEVMERHPFTTQTFAPVGLPDTVTSGFETSWPRDHDLGTGYVVIVAPGTKTEAGEDIPDMDKVRAFLANGRQAITYGVSVWHAPMVVVGKDVVGFLVTQWANGVGEEDCQEIYMEPQPVFDQRGIGVLVKGFEGHHERDES